MEREATISRVRSELDALRSDPEASPYAIRGLVDKIQKLEDQNYMALAKCDFKTIEVFKEEMGNKAARDKERELEAAFNAAHAETPATEDEIKEHKERVKAAKAQAKVDAEKAFICDNQYAITRNVMTNYRQKDTKQFLANLSTDEKAFITAATSEIAHEAQNASSARPASRGIVGPDIVDAVTGHRKSVKPTYVEARKDLHLLWDKEKSTSKPATWTNKYVETFGKFEAARKALEAAGASEDTIKNWAKTREEFELETGNSAGQKILESDSKALKPLQKTIRNYREKKNPTVDRAKLANPDRFVEELRASTAPTAPAAPTTPTAPTSADTSTASTTPVTPTPVTPTPVAPTTGTTTPVAPTPVTSTADSTAPVTPTPDGTTPVAPTTETTPVAHDGATPVAPVSHDEPDPLAHS